MPPTAELLLAFAARATHLENGIRPALAKGIWVICDRFTDATYAYQGGGRFIPKDRISYLESLVQGDLRPDLTLLLDAPIELAMARARQRNAERGEEAGDRFEREQSTFFERVRSAYLEIAESNPVRVKVIDAAQPIDQVKAAVEAAVREFIQRATK
jgi:dTMP kinase